MANEKRLEELKAAQGKLRLLVQAMVLVKADSTALDILDEVLESTADGTGTDGVDLHDLVIVAYAHSNARVEVEQRRLAAVAAERAA